jgi:hypothetical protein
MFAPLAAGAFSERVSGRNSSIDHRGARICLCGLCDLSVWTHTGDTQPLARPRLHRCAEPRWLEYRISVIAIFIAAAFAGAAGGLFMAGLVWQAGVGSVVAIGIMTFGMQRRSQILHRYRG